MFIVFSIVFDLKLFVTKTSHRALLRLVFLLVILAEVPHWLSLQWLKYVSVINSFLCAYGK